MFQWQFVILLLLMSPISQAMIINHKGSANPTIPEVVAFEDDCLEFCQDFPLISINAGVLANPKWIMNMGDWRLFDFPVIHQTTVIKEKPAKRSSFLQPTTRSYLTAFLFLLTSGLVILAILMVRRNYTFRPVFSST